MDINNNNLILFLIVSLIINFSVANYSWQISKILGLIDKPDSSRKHHKKVTPLIASLSIVFFLIFILIYDLIENFIINKDFIIIFVSSITVFAVGVLDDRIDLSPLIKIILLSIISYLSIILSENLTVTKFYISTYDTFFNLEYFSIFFTILCILTLINSFNLIDGINGLSIGVMIIWFLSYLVLYNYQLEFFTNDNFRILLLIIIINLFIIFVYNIRNTYFLGDSGTLFLSYLFGMLIIKATNENYAVGVSTFISAEQLIILFFIPFVDMVRVMLSRIKNKKNPFYGDRNHLHHYILNYTNNKNLTILIYFFYVFVPNFLSIVFNNVKIEFIIILSLTAYLITLQFIKN